MTIAVVVTIEVIVVSLVGRREEGREQRVQSAVLVEVMVDGVAGV